MKKLLFIGFGSLVAGCTFGGPSVSDVAQAIGAPESYVTDLSCKSAEGAPGYVCSFIFKTPTTGYGVFQRGSSTTMTRRFVKGSDGQWEVY